MSLCEGDDGVACNLVDNQPLCEELQCVWLGTCQSSLKSLCKNQREERLCQQVWGCNWRGPTTPMVTPPSGGGNVPATLAPRPATTAPGLVSSSSSAAAASGDSNGGIIAGAVVSGPFVAVVKCFSQRSFSRFRLAVCFS